ncbi:RNA recognition motif 2-domain-containing protein [Mortierella sp. GBAus27b]|nr:RNA recognition motif 2-domain-containing protein [Mortierella sp. GBAus27b]
MFPLFNPTSYSSGRMSGLPPFLPFVQTSTSLFVSKAPAASSRMVEEGHTFGSSILRYMTQDFTHLSTRERTNPSSRPHVSTGVFSGDGTAHTTASPNVAEQMPSYGANSLFLTDYERHVWHGYRDQPRATQTSEYDAHSLMVSQEAGAKFSPFEYDVPIAPSPESLMFERRCDSGYMPWGLDVREDAFSANTSRNATPLGGLSTVPQALTTYQTPEVVGTVPGGVKSMKGGPLNSGSFQSLNSGTPQLSSPPFGTFANSSHVGWDDYDVYAGSMSKPSIFGQGSDMAINNCPGIETRYLKVSNMARDVSVWDIQHALKGYGDLKSIFTTYLESDGIIFLEFFDIRHAAAASRRLRSIASDATKVCAQYCSKVFMSQIYTEISTNDNDGILAVSLVAPKIDGHDLLTMLSFYGDIRRVQTQSEGSTLTTLVEYYDIRHAEFAKNVLQELHNKRQITCLVSFNQVTQYTAIKGNQHSPVFRDDPKESRSPSSVGKLTEASEWLPSPEALEEYAEIERQCPILDTMDRDLAFQQKMSVGQQSLPRTCTTPQPTILGEDHSEDILSGKIEQPFSFGELSVTSGYGDFDSPSPSRDLAPCTRSPSYADATPYGTSNTQGDSQDETGVKDSRTTFMIRHIPNKYTQQMILEWVNETHFGKFDFLYLRMDFKNRCNVGYAFINFIDTDAAMSFKMEHVGKRWACFNSDKKCDMSYAAIQGRHDLIERFRNSSVMSQEPSYRPKVFYTSGPNIGQEEPFPEPNVPRSNSHGTTRLRLSSTRNKNH